MPNLLIKKLARRDDLSEEEQDRIRSMISQTREITAGTDISCFGDRPQRSTLLQSGLVIRYRGTSNGRRQILALHVPGDFVDFQSFLLKQMDHSVAALSPCKTATVPHADLRQITDEMPHLGRLFATSSLIDAAITREWLMWMGRQAAVPRIAHLLCELYVRMSVVGLVTDYAFALSLRQIDLADIVGLSAVHANRSIQALRSLGLIHWANNWIEIKDWNGLAELAEFDPTYLHLDHFGR